MPVTNYIWDTVSDNVLAATDGSHATNAVYATAPSQFGRLVSQRRNGQTSHYHYDAIGTTRALTNASESVSDTYIDDAWGNEIAQSGMTENPYRFGGQHGYYSDSATGRQAVRRRVYEPTRGRWSSKAAAGNYSTRHSAG
jgi:RHS repeat-associated protein